MANTFLTVNGYAQRFMTHLKNNCVMANLVNRAWEEEFTTKLRGYKRGNTINVELPMYSVVQDGSDCTSTKQDWNMRSFPIVLNYRKHIAHDYDELEATYSFEQLDRKFIEPDAIAMANYIDTQLLAQYVKFANQVGTVGTNPTTLRTINQAKSIMDQEAVPMDNRHCVIWSDYEVELRDHYRGMFHQMLVGEAVRKGEFAQNINGMDLHVSQNVATHTNGTACGVSGLDVVASLADGATTIGIDQAASGLTLAAGDIFTVADCLAVNPVSHIKQSRSRQFVVDETTTTTFTDLGGGNYGDTSILCVPGTSPWQMYDANASLSIKLQPYKNMTNAAEDGGYPVGNATVTVAGTASASGHVGLAFHRDSLALCMVPVQIPESFRASGNTHQEVFDGFTIAVTRGGAIADLTDTLRVDVLFGIKVTNPFMGCRIAGA